MLNFVRSFVVILFGRLQMFAQTVKRLRTLYYRVVEAFLWRLSKKNSFQLTSASGSEKWKNDSWLIFPIFFWHSWISQWQGGRCTMYSVHCNVHDSIGSRPNSEENFRFSSLIMHPHCNVHCNVTSYWLFPGRDGFSCSESELLILGAKPS